MAEKRDFLSELAKEVEQKKQGGRVKIDSVDDFVPRERAAEKPAGEAGKGAGTPAQPAPAKAPVFAEPEAAEEPETEAAEETETEEEYGKAGSPDSFEEEKLVRVDKPQLRIKKSVWIFGAIILALTAGLIWWFQFAPHITVPDFVGKSLSDVGTWAKQNKIDNSMVATKYEYNFDNAKDIVIAQDVRAGTKIKKDTPLTFTLSNGPDPDEPVDFPADLKSMTQEEIQAWITENKLSKAKITTQFSTSVASGNVISYDLKSVSENNFTRGTSLSVICSKGPAPAGQVTVEDFTNKTLAEAQTWAASKKVKLVSAEQYSDTVTSGNIISQDKKAGDAMAEGDTITFIVSKGKGVTIPNLVGFDKDELAAWQADKNNTVVVVPHSIYNTALEGTVVNQSIAAGTKVDSGTVLMLDISAYMPILETNSKAWLGKDYLELIAWCDQVNAKGANIQAGEYDQANRPNHCSDTYPTEGQIIDYWCNNDSTSSVIADGCGRPLGLNARIGYAVSTGPCTVKVQIPITQADVASITAINSFCTANKMSCVFTVDETDPSLSAGGTIAAQYTAAGASSAVKRYSNDGNFTDFLYSGDSIQVFYKNK